MCFHTSFLGDDFPNAQDLLNAVLNYEENPENLNVDQVDPMSAQGEVTSPVAGPSTSMSPGGSLDIPPSPRNPSAAGGGGGGRCLYCLFGEYFLILLVHTMDLDFYLDVSSFKVTVFYLSKMQVLRLNM